MVQYSKQMQSSSSKSALSKEEGLFNLTAKLMKPKGEKPDKLSRASSRQGAGDELAPQGASAWTQHHNSWGNWSSRCLERYHEFCASSATEIFPEKCSVQPWCELEKKFHGKFAAFSAQRRILNKHIKKINWVKNKQKGLGIHTLTAVVQSIQIHGKLDNSLLIKVHLDRAQWSHVESKVKLCLVFRGSLQINMLIWSLQSSSCKPMTENVIHDKIKERKKM